MGTAACLVLCFLLLCALLFLACYLGTGGDERNMRSFWSYPAAAREAALREPRLAAMAPPAPGLKGRMASFLGNLALFTALLTLAGLIARPTGFAEAFLGLLAVGEGLGLFDLLVIDALWWRRSPRVRLSGARDPELYRDMRPHLASFARGVPMFALAALFAGLITSAAGA